VLDTPATNTSPSLTRRLYSFEQNLRQFMPVWMAYDMRQMAERFISDGMLPSAGDVERLMQLLGRPLRSCRAFAAVAASTG
jgi:hypothetical protein